MRFTWRHTWAIRAGGSYVRLSLDVLWGIPSIVYGAFGFTLMLAIGLRASLLAGIIVLALLELPIMVRAMDEVIRRMPTISNTPRWHLARPSWRWRCGW